MKELSKTSRPGTIVDVTVMDGFTGSVKVLENKRYKWFVEIVDVCMCYPQQVQLQVGEKMWLHESELYREILNELDLSGEKSSMFNDFNKEGFIAYLEEEFSGFDHSFLRGIVSNVIDFALANYNVSLDQLGYFLSDMLPEVEFADVVAFMDDSKLTAHGREVKAETVYLMHEKAIENKTFSLDEINNWPLSITDLIATYEELYEVPEQECVTKYFVEFGQFFLKSVISVDDAKEISAAFHKALKAVDMTADDFIKENSSFISRNEIKDLMKRKMLSPLDDKIMSAEGQKAEQNISRFFENIER